MSRVFVYLEILLSLLHAYRHKGFSCGISRFQPQSSRCLPHRSTRPAESTLGATQQLVAGLPWERWQMPRLCGDQQYAEPIGYVGSGGSAVTLSVQADAGHGHSAVVKIPREPEEDDLANECAFMKFLEYQGVQNVLRCEALCQAEIRIDGGTHQVTQIITHPLLLNATSFPPMVNDIMRATWHTAVSMLAAGVVNSDLAGNLIYAADGTPLFIDLGMGVLIYSENETDFSQFTEFEFVTQQRPYKMTASEAAASGKLGSHINGALEHLVDLEVDFLQQGWAAAWKESASKRKYEPPGIYPVAEEIFHGALLLHTVGFHKNWDSVLADDIEVGKALRISTESEHPRGEIWSKCKGMALDRVKDLLEYLQEFVNETDDTRISRIDAAQRTLALLEA